MEGSRCPSVFRVGSPYVQFLAQSAYLFLNTYTQPNFKKLYHIVCWRIRALNIFFVRANPFPLSQISRRTSPEGRWTTVCCPPGRLCERRVLFMYTHPIRFEFDTLPALAIERSWTQDYQGDSRVFALEVIESYRKKSAGGEQRYACYTTVVQSSGMGKSRMMDQMATLVPTIPVNLRPNGDTGIHSAWSALSVRL
jgi:hypothetical protein